MPCNSDYINPSGVEYAQLPLVNLQQQKSVKGKTMNETVRKSMAMLIGMATLQRYLLVNHLRKEKAKSRPLDGLRVHAANLQDIEGMIEAEDKRIEHYLEAVTAMDDC